LIKDDVLWIVDHADTIALLPGYEKSKGATVELAMVEFLGLSAMVLGHRYLAGAEYKRQWKPDNPRALVAPHA
jgi:hypothetical protein